MRAGEGYSKWWVFQGLGCWLVHAPAQYTSWHRLTHFPSWREAYDYAHTHPSNSKETPT